MNWFKKAQSPYEIGQRLIDLAKKYYGLTDNLIFAGFLLPDGSMLNFSYDQRQRDIDHRDINSILEYSPELDNKLNSNGEFTFYQFMKLTGSIRIDGHADYLGIDIIQPPTIYQKKIIHQYTNITKNIKIDFTDPNTLKIKDSYSFTFPSLRDFQTTWRDIDRSYKGEEKNKNKYPQSIYEAFSDVYGDEIYPDEVDQEDYSTVRATASMGLSGGSDEFDEIMSHYRTTLQGQKNINWHKIAQNSFNGYSNYMDIGHNQNDKDALWISDINGNNFHISDTTDYDHFGLSYDAGLDFEKGFIQGRYDSDKKIVSLVLDPRIASVRNLPNRLINRLYDEFGRNIIILNYSYGKPTRII
jgi:hypothetical protein